MANQKQWTRNYDNMFSAVFGTTDGSVGTTETPTHDRPWFRDAGGTYRGFRLAIETKSNTAKLLSVDKISRYGVNTSTFTTTSISTTSDSVYSNHTIQLGTGVGNVSYEDYKLISPVTTNMTLGTIARSWAYNEETHTYTVTLKVPIVYSGVTPINITEYGVFAPLFCGNDYKTMVDGLVYHEIFEEAITLEQNDVIEITFTQSIVQPNYTEYPATDTTEV